MVSTLSKDQIEKINDLQRQKSLYLTILASDESAKKKLESLYQRLDSDMKNYATGALTSTALKPTYKNPYVAGGIGSAIGGSILGVYSAMKIDQENEQKREAYNKAATSAAASQVSANRYYSHVIDDIEAINKFIRNNPLIAEQKKKEQEENKRLEKYEKDVHLSFVLQKLKSDNAKELRDALGEIKILRWTTSSPIDEKLIKDAEERCAKLEEEDRQSKRQGLKKKWSKIVLSVAGIAAVFVIALIVVSKVIIPNRNEQKYQEAATLYEAGEKYEAAKAFYAIKDFKDAKEKSFAIWREIIPTSSTDSLYNNSFFVLEDYTVRVIGSDYFNEIDVTDWTDIISVSSRGSSAIGLKSDGSVVYSKDGSNAETWIDMVAVKLGGPTLGIKADGTAAVLTNFQYMENVVNGFGEVLNIETGYNNQDWVMGLKPNGHVVVHTDSSKDKNLKEAEKWEDVISIASNSWTLAAGLTSDGTILTTDDRLTKALENNDGVMKIAVGVHNILGLRKDGTLVIGDSYDDDVYVEERYTFADIGAGGYGIDPSGDCWKIEYEDGEVYYTKISLSQGVYISDSGVELDANNIRYPEPNAKKSSVSNSGKKSSSSSSKTESKKSRKCPNCNGSGIVKFYYGSSDLEAYLDGVDPYTWEECPMCHGTGYVDD